MEPSVEVRVLARADAASLRAMLAVFATAFDDVETYAAIALYGKLGVREDVLHFDIAPSPR